VTKGKCDTVSEGKGRGEGMSHDLRRVLSQDDFRALAEKTTPKASPQFAGALQENAFHFPPRVGHSDSVAIRTDDDVFIRESYTKSGLTKCPPVWPGILSKPIAKVELFVYPKREGKWYVL
jgi:hypothetical protein